MHVDPDVSRPPPAVRRTGSRRSTSARICSSGQFPCLLPSVPRSAPPPSGAAGRRRSPASAFPLAPVADVRPWFVRLRVAASPHPSLPTCPAEMPRSRPTRLVSSLSGPSHARSPQPKGSEAAPDFNKGRVLGVSPLSPACLPPARCSLVRSLACSLLGSLVARGSDPPPLRACYPTFASLYALAF